MCVQEFFLEYEHCDLCILNLKVLLDQMRYLSSTSYTIHKPLVVGSMLTYFETVVNVLVNV